MTRHALLFLLGVCTATVTFGAEPVVLKIDASEKDILFTDNVALAKADRVVKTGPYKATIKYGAATSSFDGEIEVQEGTLAAQYLQNFGTPTKITVSDGATLDLTSENTTATGTGYIANANIYIAGTGVNGGGAIRRTGSLIINALLGTVTLTADARICNSVQIGCSGPINLEGHTLTIDAGIAGTASGSVFYFPNGQFMKNGSTDDPGHVIVRSGTFFPTGTAMQGGSDANTVTLQDNTVTLKHYKPILRLRNTDTHIAWKLIVEGDNAGYIEDDENGSTAAQNVWAGPVELKKQLTVYPKVDGSHLTLAGGVTGHFPVANAWGSNKGLLTLTGTNDIGKIVSRSGRTVFEGGKTTFNERMDATAGSIAFKDTEAHWASLSPLYVGGSSGANAVRLDIDHSTVTTVTNSNGGSGCRFYVGSGTETGATNLYGFVTVRNGSVVSNIAASVGHSGYGGMLVDGSDYYWPVFGFAFDSLGYNRGSYGYLAITNSRFTVDSSFFPANNENVYSFFGGYGTAVLTARAGSDLKFIGSSSRTRVEFGAYTGSRFNAYLEGGAKMTVPETLDFGRAASHAQSGAAEVTLTGAGTTLEVGLYTRVFWTNADGDFTMNVNDGATLAAQNLYRLDDGVGCQMKVNFNGGVISKVGKGWFANGTNWNDVARQPTRVTVYEKGVTFDTSRLSASENVTMEYTFQKPGEGKRIKSISLPTDAAYASDTFMGPPTVKITGKGEGATAFVDYDDVNHVNRGVIVTSPGWGYDEDTVVTIESGNRKSTYACAFTLEDQPETGWVGFRKTGAARLNMYGANTYRGATEVEAGILGFHRPNTPQGGLPAGSGLILRKGATITFDAANTPVTVPFIRGCGTTSFGCFTVTNAIEASVAELAAGSHLTVNQKLTLGEDCVIRILDAENLTDDMPAKMTLVEAKNGLATFTMRPKVVFVRNGVESEEGDWHATVVGNRVELRRNSGMVILVR